MIGILRQMLLMTTQVMKKLEGIDNTGRQNSATLKSLEARFTEERRPSQGTLKTMEEFEEQQLANN